MIQINVLSGFIGEGVKILKRLPEAFHNRRIILSAGILFLGAFPELIDQVFSIGGGEIASEDSSNGGITVNTISTFPLISFIYAAGFLSPFISGADVRRRNDSPVSCVVEYLSRHRRNCLLYDLKKVS